MTKDEALKLAFGEIGRLVETGKYTFETIKTMQAIKEALAQPEQAPMHYYRADAEGNLERTDIHFAQPERLAELGWQEIDCPICGGGARAFPKPEQEKEKKQ